MRRHPPVGEKGVNIAWDKEPDFPPLIPPAPQPCGIGSLKNNHGIRLSHFLLCRQSLCTCHATTRGRLPKDPYSSHMQGVTYEMPCRKGVPSLTFNDGKRRTLDAVSKGRHLGAWLPAPRSAGGCASTTHRSPPRLVLWTESWSTGGGKMRSGEGRSGRLPCGIS